MPLKFPGEWRFSPPVPENPDHAVISGSAVAAFESLIHKTAMQGRPKATYEHFKAHFCAAAGAPYYPSSDTGWAQTDLSTAMGDSALNPPMFIEAFHDACETFSADNTDEPWAPDADMINEVCRRHDVPYKIVRNKLVYTGEDKPVVQVEERPRSLQDDAHEQISKSLQRGEELLSQGHGREAVQETLWLLESVTTAFRGVDAGANISIGGKYFNRIVKELRAAYLVGSHLFDR